MPHRFPPRRRVPPLPRHALRHRLRLWSRPGLGSRPGVGRRPGMWSRLGVGGRPGMPGRLPLWSRLGVPGGFSLGGGRAPAAPGGPGPLPAPRRRGPARLLPRRHGLLRRLLVLAVAAGVLGAATAGAAGAWVRQQARGHLHSPATVPAAPVALVLGTQVDENGHPSEFLAGRLAVARDLYAAGTVRAILVSGDHMRWEYDEPQAMHDWLVAAGVPPQHVVLDHAGFDTYDSCARAARIFGVRRAIVVTQTFHLPRAVTLCRHLGIDASGVGDDTVARHRWPWFAASAREQAAHVKAVADLLSGRDPVHLGRQETGVADALRS